MKTLAFMIAIAASACGGKKAQPAAPAEAAPPAAAGSGSAQSACAAQGGECISQAAAVACGTKSHLGDCPDTTAPYCCIR